MKTCKIKIEDLQPGMVLAENIYQNKLILLPAGMILNTLYIEKLTFLKLGDSILIEQPKSIDNTEKKDNSKKNLSTTSASEELVKISRSLKNFFTEKDMDDSIENHQLNEIQDEMISNFELLKKTLKALFVKTTMDDYIYIHSLNVAFLSYLIGTWCNLSEEELSDLITSGLLHDIGKLKINPNILYKSGKLSEKEFETLKKHPLLGYNHLKNSDLFSQEVALGVLTHHENFDGTGFPLKLKGDQIHIFGRILNIADTFSTLTLNKPNKDSLSPLDALEVMKEEHFSKYDYCIWDIFYKNMLDYYTGDIVLLNTGEKGKLIKLFEDSPSRPLVFVEETYFAHLKLDQSRWIKSIIEHT